MGSKCARGHGVSELLAARHAASVVCAQTGLNGGAAWLCEVSYQMATAKVTHG